MQSASWSAKKKKIKKRKKKNKNCEKEEPLFVFFWTSNENLRLYCTGFVDATVLVLLLYICNCVWITHIYDDKRAFFSQTHIVPNASIVACRSFLISICIQIVVISYFYYTHTKKGWVQHMMQFQLERVFHSQPPFHYAAVWMNLAGRWLYEDSSFHLEESPLLSHRGFAS